jgi:hypothetical protein
VSQARATAEREIFEEKAAAEREVLKKELEAVKKESAIERTKCGVE